MHLHGRLPGDWGALAGSPAAMHLVSRAEKGPDRSVTFIVIAVIIFVLVVIAAVALWTKRRKKQHRATGQTHQSTNRWTRLNPFKSKGSRYQTAHGGESAELNPTSTRANRNNERGSQGRANRSGGTAGATVDRNTSIRSVLTLPAYSQAASHTEQVIGREGERDGVDVVVDFPTEQDEEALREQEMNALYQLRETRRQQHADRDEMRRLRREAQQRNDSATLAELRSRARIASNSHQSLVDELRRDIDHAKENRQRSTSSVSYADLGVARHDGTRIRASSQESERMGLLSDPADMGHLNRPGAESPLSHQRGRSASSIGSFDGDFPSPALSRPRAGSGLSTLRAGSSPDIEESDVANENMPPPEYEDVSLNDDDHSSLEHARDATHGPPPDYPGPHRSDSQRTYSSGQASADDVDTAGRQSSRMSTGRGVGGAPQLPSLRIGRLPEIRIEPSSAIPQPEVDDSRQETSERQPGR
ncbi:uncharacterized protein F5Z01DRAFT_541418 [Emericellopsis atlantica]|uniref:Uncharacterized protein n=1 Tax=Emericellopsis atlantica TaxID=2614577 RepID=A0A9P8CSU9_9HYPO|nr:uncharacterized protein F5Z01DRAFT_541418 [Emericellopsis atlantica]KAG9256141.1 hypothetical protein F5Z01DRAFT_541418 [Emericellopsis atlantica]